jgi:protein TonB
MSASAALKVRHSLYLHIGLVCAVVIHALAFALWPEYAPAVYRLPSDIIRVLPPPPEFQIPPPPRDIEPPQRPVQIDPTDNADRDATIPPTLLDAYRNLPPVPPAPPTATDRFFAFDKPPELIEAAKPEYPDIARKAGVEGLVVVWVLVDEAGNVVSAEIAASDAAILNQTCLDAAYRHRFLPAYQRDVPVKSKISLRFRFVLDD